MLEFAGATLQLLYITRGMILKSCNFPELKDSRRRAAILRMTKTLSSYKGQDSLKKASQMAEAIQNTQERLVDAARDIRTKKRRGGA